MRLLITCVSCGQAWTVAHTFSIYEQQAVESCPCPHCGAYTLCCHAEDGEPASVLFPVDHPLSIIHH